MIPNENKTIFKIWFDGLRLLMGFLFTAQRKAQNLERKKKKLNEQNCIYTTLSYYCNIKLKLFGIKERCIYDDRSMGNEEGNHN